MNDGRADGDRTDTESTDAERADTERTAVKTYVPAYQKEAWRDHADELDASLSEFVRTMVQAGRRGFGADVAVEGATTSPPTSDGAPTPTAADGGRDVEKRVVETLEAEGALSWDELLAASVPEDFEDAVGGTIDRLQDENRVAYRPRDGVFELTDDER